MATTQHNYVRRPYKPKGVSLTVPNQVHTVSQIAERFRRGQGVQAFPGVYNPELPPGLEKLDKIGRIEAAREAAANVAAIRQQLQNQPIQSTPKQVILDNDLVEPKP